MGGALGFLGLDDRYEQLNKFGDPLAHLPAVEGFEALRYRLEMAWERSDGSMDGGPFVIRILAFKAQVIRALHSFCCQSLWKPQPAALFF